MANSYLQSFIVGSSSPVFLPFFYGITQLKSKKFDYESYMFRAPLYFGIANMLRILLKHQFGFSEKKSYILMSQLSPAFVSAWITYFQSYDFDTKLRWFKQYALLWLAHGFTWLVTIPKITQSIS